MPELVGSWDPGDLKTGLMRRAARRPFFFPQLSGPVATQVSSSSTQDADFTQVPRNVYWRCACAQIHHLAFTHRFMVDPEKKNV
jgi:hypothetical protein